MDNAERNLLAIKRLLAAFIGFAAIGSAFGGVNDWTKIGPEGGRIYEVVYHRTTPSTMYAMASSGLHRSSDGGVTWRLSPVDIFPGPAHISLDPSHPDRFYFNTYNRAFVSTDRAMTFQLLPVPVGVIVHVLQVAVDGTLYATTEGVVNFYRSTDQGQNWIAGSAPRGPILLDPSNAATLYSVAAGDGIYMSTNSGVSWTRYADSTVLDNLRFLGRIEIDPQMSNRWWALASSKVLFSNDRGVSWSEVYTGSTSTASDWPMTLVFSPTDSSLVYIGLSGGRLLSTHDQGAHWISAGNRGEMLSALAINPLQPTEVMIGSLSGLAIGSVNATTWTPRNSGLISTYATRFVAGGSGRTYFVSNSGVYFLQGDTVQPANNAGLLQVARDAYDAHGFLFPTLHIPSGAPNTLYLADDFRLYKSIDAGITWSALPYVPKNVWGFTGSRLDPQILYVGSYDGVIKSTNGGLTWAPINNGLPAYEPPPSLFQGAYVYSLASGNDPSLIYAGTMGAGVYKSVNAGHSWAAANNGIADKRVYAIKIDPTNDQILYAATISNDNSSRSIAKSTDGGASWTNILTNSTMNYWGIAIDPSNPRILVVSGESRVFRSIDGGDTWQTIRESPTTFRTTDMNYAVIDSERPEVVFVGTGVDGVHQHTIAPDMVAVVTPPNSLTRGVAASYSLNVSNLGPWHATGIRVSLQLPSSASAVSISGEATCSNSGGPWTCTLAQLKSASFSTIDIRITPDSAGPFTVVASINSAQPDADTSNNTATSTISATEPTSASGSSGGGGALSWALLLLLFCLGGCGHWHRYPR